MLENKMENHVEYYYSTPIIKNNKTEYKIVLAKEATQTEEFSANELARYLNQITGVKIPVCVEDIRQTSNDKIISIGKTEFSKSIYKDIKNIDFNIDGFVIRTYGKSLILFGGASQRGTLFAVYELLEKCFGCKFLTPECEFVPLKDEVFLPRLNIVDIPAFGIREVVYDTLMDDAFSAKMRLYPFPNPDCPESTKFGETLKRYIWSQCHNVTSDIIPYEEYKDTNREWFYTADNGIINFIFSSGLTENGEYDENLRLNPIDVAVVNLKQAILNSNAKYFQVSQCDVDTLCKDKTYCEMSTKYTDSGVMLLFLNQVCKRLDDWIKNEVDANGNKLFPNGREYKIMTFAYSYTQFPPVDKKGNILVNIHKNIFIWLAPIEFNCLYPYNHDMQIHYVTQLIPNWTKITKNVGVWDYYSNFPANSMYYTPYLSTAIENYKFYISCGIKEYVLTEFSGYNKSPRNAFDEIKTYIASKIMWNPNKESVEYYLKEFCSYYYQGYSDSVLKVINNMEKQINYLTHCSRNYSLCHSALNWAQYFPLDLLKENERIIAEAIKENEKDKKKSGYKELDLRLKKLKLLFVFNQAYEFDSYYPQSTSKEREEFYNYYFKCLEETKWNNFIGKDSDFFIKNEIEQFSLKKGEKI